MPYATITSRKADEDFQNIKSRYADLVTGMVNQKMRVDQFNQQRDQQKQAEMQNQQIMQNDMKQAEMTNNTTVQKNAMDFHTKQMELEIKKSALAQP